MEFVDAVTEKGGRDYVEPAERIATSTTTARCGLNTPCIPKFFSPLTASRRSHRSTRSEDHAAFQGTAGRRHENRRRIGNEGSDGDPHGDALRHDRRRVEQEASNWLATNKQPKFKRLYSESIYQPQLELLAYLRANGFKTFIVSGGGIQFMRPITERNYGIRRNRSSAQAWSPNSSSKWSAGARSPAEDRLHQR